MYALNLVNIPNKYKLWNFYPPIRFFCEVQMHKQLSKKKNIKHEMVSFFPSIMLELACSPSLMCDTTLGWRWYELPHTQKLLSIFLIIYWEFYCFSFWQSHFFYGEYEQLGDNTMFITNVFKFIGCEATTSIQLNWWKNHLYYPLRFKFLEHCQHLHFF